MWVWVWKWVCQCVYIHLSMYKILEIICFHILNTYPWNHIRQIYANSSAQFLHLSQNTPVCIHLSAHTYPYLSKWNSQYIDIYIYTLTQTYTHINTSLKRFSKICRYFSYYTYIYIHICIYIYREREREKDR